jgi:hypothetical protein
LRFSRAYQSTGKVHTLFQLSGDDGNPANLAYPHYLGHGSDFPLGAKQSTKKGFREEPK